MGFSVSNPKYLYQSPSGYIFRLCIPLDLRNVVGKSEFRYSLRTGILRVAKHRARCIASYIHQLFIKVRNRMSDFSKESINQLVQEYIRKTLADDEKCRAQGIHTLSEDLYVTGGSNMGEKEAQSLDKSVRRLLSDQDHSLLHPMANQLLSQHGLTIDPESEDYKTLSRELMVAFQSILKVRIKRSQGDYSMSDHELIPSLESEHISTSQSQETPAENPNRKKFSEVQERYVKEIAKGNNWTEKTKAENLAIFELFTRAMGDLPVDQIDKTLMSDYKSILMQLPPNLNKSPIYKDMEIQEILASKPKKTISTNTLNKYIRRLSGLFNFATSNGYMSSNPAEGMQIRSSKRMDQERNVYSQEDLEKLFGTPDYLEGKHRKPYCFWTPLIALFTGCRLEEICQLHLKDIRQVDGIWVFDINDKDEKRLKTLSSERMVPIHKQLLDIGLVDYIRWLKERGAGRLFPELKQTRDGYGQAVSKWFGRYKTRYGFGEGHNFHSFRHTFITHLKHKQVDTYMIHELDGHTVDSETMGRYGKRYTPEMLLRDAIEKIDYGVDFSRLKWSVEMLK